MKKSILSICFLWVVITSASFGQTPIKLEINHKLGQQAFAMNQMAYNNLMIEFKVTNLRYYLSEFSITHDGGQLTEVPDVLVFVDTEADSLGNHIVELGEYSVTDIESISFHMGVDSGRNHLDPAAYPPSHPLAPKNPSMHWGWASGYFFLSLNANSGLNYASQVDLQCLGDVNYFQTTVDSPLVTTYSDEILISIDGDYTGLLHGMDISKSISMHGEFLWANQALVNAALRVFSPSPAPGATAIASDVSQEWVSIFPNPITSGQKLSIQPHSSGAKYDWAVYDLAGRTLTKQAHAIGRSNISFASFQAGIYILRLDYGNGKMISRKIVVE